MAAPAAPAGLARAALVALTWAALAPAAAGERAGAEQALMSADDEAELSVHRSGVGRSISNTSEDRWVVIQVDNDTPYDIAELVVIHKFLGVTPPTHTLSFKNLPAKTLSSFDRSQRVETSVGGLTTRQDWWLVTWRFNESVHACQSCIKESGQCETWVTQPNNAFGQWFLNPANYVKLFTAAWNIAVTGVSLGTATMASVALTGLLTEGLAQKLADAETTDGFKGCSLSRADAENSLGRQPVRIRILERPDRALASRFEVQWIQFKEGERNVPRGITPDWRGVRDSCSCYGGPMPCKVEDSAPGDTVKVAVVNRSGKRIKQYSVVHKFNGLHPQVHIADGRGESLEDGEQSKSGSALVKTVTGAFSWRNDWWVVGWSYEGPGENDCQAYTMMDEGFLEDIRKNPADLLLSAGIMASKALLDVDALVDGTTGLIGSMLGEPSAKLDMTDGPTVRIFGLKLMENLVKKGSTKAFLKCNLNGLDVLNSKNGKPVQIVIEKHRVIIQAGGGQDATKCVGFVHPLACMQTKDCEGVVDTCKKKPKHSGDAIVDGVMEGMDIVDSVT